MDDDVERLFPDRSPVEALTEAHTITDQAIGEHKPVKTFLLFSGGRNDWS